MKIILMWTISDLLVYGMVSGWNTYEKLSYPYCMENKKAFTFMNGGKAFFFIVTRGFYQVIIDTETTKITS